MTATAFRTAAKLTFCSVAAIGVLVGCSEQGKRLNSPPQGHSDRPHEMQQQFVYMTDNAILQDSSIADIHFVPHTAELSGVGIRKLNRMIEVLGVCGGTICYDTSLRNEYLVNERLDTVRQYIAGAGVDAATLDVAAARNRGRGIRAQEALTARDEMNASGPAGGATTGAALGSSSGGGGI